MSAEKPQGGGSAVRPVRMDQEYQLQNLRRLAMDQDFDSMGQYAGVYPNEAGRAQKDIVSHAARGYLGQDTRPHIESSMAVGTETDATHLAQTLNQNMTARQDTQPQVQDGHAMPVIWQAHDGLMPTPNTVLGSEIDTWKMTTSPPRLFMTPRELTGSVHGVSDELSSFGTRASSSAFSLVSGGGDDRLTATDNVVRIPRSTVVDTDGPMWSDPYPGGFRHVVHNPDASPTPAARGGRLKQGPSLVSRLAFAPGYGEGDDQPSRSVSGASGVSDIRSQAMSLYDIASSAGSASPHHGIPPFVSDADETIKFVGGRVYPRAFRTGWVHQSKPDAAIRSTEAPEDQHVSMQDRVVGPHGHRYRQNIPAPLGYGYTGNNTAYPAANPGLGPTTSGPGGCQSSQAMASAHHPALASPIVMSRPSLTPFRPSTGLGNGNPMINLNQLPGLSPALAPSMAAPSPPLAKLIGSLDGDSSAAKILGAESFPFIETAREGGGPVNHGVIKITNVPFETGRNEVYAFLGRNSRVLHDNMEPIHIMMCRVTGKTLDIYVELQTAADATRAVERHLDNCAAGRPSKLGDRQVDVHLSDQAGLMKMMFPKAHAVHWVGSVPAVPEKTISKYQTFRGFLSDEELTMMLKHVENPARCPFSRGCPERPFECLVGTLKKFPWDKTKHITLRQRYLIFHTTYKFLDILKKKVDRGIHPVRLTTSLLKRLIATAMTCPGFTVMQKADIAYLVGLDGDRSREFGLPPFADQWRHQYATSVKIGAPFDLVGWYVGVIAKESEENLHEKFSLRERQEIQRLASSTDSRWGYFWLELNLPCVKDLEGMTLHELAEREFFVIEDILRRAARKMDGGRSIQQ